jgi:hypothetical protein
MGTIQNLSTEAKRTKTKRAFTKSKSMFALIKIQDGETKITLCRELRHHAALGLMDGTIKAINIDERTMFNHRSGTWEILAPVDSDDNQLWLPAAEVCANGETQPA